MSKLWGGRFSQKLDKQVERFSQSIHFDLELARYDCVGSLAHIDVLKKAKILTASEHLKLKKGLEGILRSIESGAFVKSVDMSVEDIHTYIQDLLEKKAGKVALKLHSCRSRNDQVVFATKLYCLDNINQTQARIEAMQNALKKAAKKNKNVIIPGFTHLQHAIPVKMSDYFYAYHDMLERDKQRLTNAAGNITLTLGAGALAGTFIPASLYRMKGKPYIKGLQFKIEPTANALDTVSDRDFIMEILNSLSIAGMHLSRMAEDLILWVSEEFGYISIADAFCTGSSLMPHKKNPDVLELVRGSTGRLYGNANSVSVVMKGLPLSYNRDMQYDKEPLFDSFHVINQSLSIMTSLLGHVSVNKVKVAKQVDDEALYATDITDYLVQQDVPFKSAHSLVGKLIRAKYKKKTALVDMEARDLAKIHPSLTPNVVKKIIDPKRSVRSKKSVRKRN